MVISICLVIPFSTAVCERGFSTMNRIKTDWSSSLQINSCDNLMGISIDGKPLQTFDPTFAIKKWWASPEFKN